MSYFVILPENAVQHIVRKLSRYRIGRDMTNRPILLMHYTVPTENKYISHALMLIRVGMKYINIMDYTVIIPSGVSYIVDMQGPLNIMFENLTLR